jgi:hypothetical protein
MTQAVIQRIVDMVAETVATMALAGGEGPGGLSGIDQLLRARIAHHLAKAGAEPRAIAALFDVKSEVTVKRWLRESPMAPGSADLSMLLGLVEQQPGIGRDELLATFAEHAAGGDSMDRYRRARERGIALLAFLCRAGMLCEDKGEAGQNGASGELCYQVNGKNGANGDHPEDDAVLVHLHAHGPVTESMLASALGLPSGKVSKALERLGKLALAIRSGGFWYATEARQEGDTPASWEASTLDHLEAVFATVNARLRDYLPDGSRDTPPKGTGFETQEFCLAGREIRTLLDTLPTLAKALEKQQRERVDGPTLRLYFGQSISKVPR